MFVTRWLLALLSLAWAYWSCAAPVSLTDDLGRRVELAKPATRIIALAPHIVENLYSAGAGSRLVGAVGYSDYPEAAKQLPRVGRISTYNYEAIIALQPDLVVVWMPTRGGEALAQLERLGLTTYADDPQSLADVAQSIRAFGRLAGTSQVAEAEALRYEAKLGALREQYRATRTVRVFYEVWFDPLQTVNDQHIISDVLRLCGGRNLFGNHAILAPKISMEALLALNPEAIIRGGDASTHGAWAASWAVWPQLRAVANQHLYTVPADWIARHTVRILVGAERICEQLSELRQ